MWWGGGPFYHGWFGFGGIIMMIFFFLIVLACLFFAFRWISGSNGCGYFRHNNHKDEPLDILKRRYASGEITKEEFEEAKKHLL